MKYRNDFVTNSSSSSFVCEICGCADSGYDASPDDLGFAECSKGHVFCREHIDFDSMNVEELIEKLKDQYDFSELEPGIKDARQLYEFILRDYYELPSEMCPICNMEEIASCDLSAYKNALLEKTDRELVEQIKKVFSNKEDFNNFIKKYKG